MTAKGGCVASGKAAAAPAAAHGVIESKQESLGSVLPAQGLFFL
jgi:hypothetical protein